MFLGNTRDCDLLLKILRGLEFLDKSGKPSIPCGIHTFSRQLFSSLRRRKDSPPEADAPLAQNPRYLTVHTLSPAQSGKDGIRTHGGFPHTRFPSVRFRPLSHLSALSGIVIPSVDLCPYGTSPVGMTAGMTIFVPENCNAGAIFRQIGNRTAVPTTRAPLLFTKSRSYRCDYNAT